MSAAELIDRTLFERYSGLSLPRHVAYPMPTWWQSLDPEQAASLRGACADRDAGLSLYLHLPFCQALCRFCACNKTILKKEKDGAALRVERYLGALESELTDRAPQLAGQRVHQLHWGGGTPTYLDVDQIARLHRATCEHYELAPDAELSIEVDPRVTSVDQLRMLRELGFNRISLGVQDFDAEVQRHVNRIQPFESVAEIVEASRSLGFESVNFDLIYGLPLQHRSSVAEMVERSLSLRPDRVAFYHYAQIPDRIATQRGLDHTALPDSWTKLEMFLEASERFQGHGYRFIGLDHFALPDERLARAIESGEIHRSFQGMTTGAQLDLYGFGASAISVLPRRAYWQNSHDVSDYVERIERGGETALRGKRLTREDGLRQALLLDLYCHAAVDPARIESRFGISFREHFAAAAPALDRLQDDGLLRWSWNEGVRLTDPLGRVLMRNVAAVFDAYLDSDAPWNGVRNTYSASA